MIFFVEQELNSNLVVFDGLLVSLKFSRQFRTKINKIHTFKTLSTLISSLEICSKINLSSFICPLTTQQSSTDRIFLWRIWLIVFYFLRLFSFVVFILCRLSSSRKKSLSIKDRRRQRQDETNIWRWKWFSSLFTNWRWY